MFPIYSPKIENYDEKHLLVNRHLFSTHPLVTLKENDYARYFKYDTQEKEVQSSILFIFVYILIYLFFFFKLYFYLRKK